MIFALGAFSPEPKRKDRIYEELLEHVETADMVGMSIYTNYYLEAVGVTKLIKETNSVPIVWGGVHPTVEPEDALKFADYVCISEGEDAMPDLLRSIGGDFPLEQVPNICYLGQDGEIRRNHVQQLQHELDQYPFPLFTDLSPVFVSSEDQSSITNLTEDRLKSLIRYNGSYYGLPTDIPYYGYLTLTTRGCPYRCTYCVNNFLNTQKTGKGRFFRNRAIENVIEELEAVIERFPYINLIHLFDDNLCARPLDDIKLFNKLYKETIDLPYKCNFHPNNVSEEKIDLLVDAGLVSVEMGIESGSKRTNKELYKRPHKDEHILTCGSLISEKYKGRVVPYYDVIMDNPWENHEDVSKTIRLIQKLPRPFKLSHFSLTFFPGTDLYFRALQDGLIENFVEEVVKKKNNRLYADKDPFSKLLVSISPYVESTLGRQVISLLAHPSLLQIMNSKLMSKPMRKLTESMIVFKTWFNMKRARRSLSAPTEDAGSGQKPPFAYRKSRELPTEDLVLEDYR